MPTHPGEVVLFNQMRRRATMEKIAATLELGRIVRVGLVAGCPVSLFLVDNLKAAMRAVTSEENMASFTDGRGMRAVNTLRVVETLCSGLGLNKEEATDLGRKAVERLGGRFELVEHQGGIVGVAPNWELREDWWIPQDAVHE